MSMTMPEMTARLKKDAGVTLTEIMVVVAILGALTALAVPNFVEWNSKAKLRDAAGLVSGNMNLARVSAINLGSTVTVTVCYKTATCPAAPVATANPAPNQVTVFFRNSAGADLMPVMTLNPLIALTDASNNPIGAAVQSPQDVQFSPVGIRQFTGTNANNLCVANTGAYTGCAAGNAQVFNLKNERNLNYRVVVAPSGKTVFCYIPTCAGN
jgi:prepilin-type N-terminal cleavage/methylation domain-containing protein